MESQGVQESTQEEGELGGLETDRHTDTDMHPHKHTKGVRQ